MEILELLPFSMFTVIALISLVSAILWQLTFWQRQGLPNDWRSVYNRYLTPFHLADDWTTRNYGKFVGTYEFFKPALCVSDPEIVKKILITDFHKWANHRVWGGANNIGSRNVFRLEYKPWRPVRQILTPGLSMAKLKSFVPLMNTEVDNLMVQMKQLAKSNKPIDVKNYFIALTIDIIASCTYGVCLEMTKRPHNDVVYSARRIFGKNMNIQNLITYLSPRLATIFSTDMVDKVFREYVSDLAHKTIKQRQNNPALRRNDIIQLVIDAETEEKGKLEKLNGELKLNDRQILGGKEMIDNAFVIFLAGFDAPSIALSSIAYCLALNPKVQDVLLDEIREFHENNKEITYENVHSLKYLDAVIHETLRLFPPVMRTERRAVENIEFEGLKIPKGTIAVLPSYVIHRDPDFWPEPLEFKPERFLSENTHKHHPFAYIPFAGGIRNCIGIRFALTEMKVVYVRLLQKYKFERCEETKYPPEWFIGQLITTPKELIVKVVPIDETYSLA